ncbi:hypothetical protein C8R43DRAFT_1123164 [Mycena crocata]|nr:hypothetical protein C8R43DRAFT_1123164 [Mycena crocata]
MDDPVLRILKQMQHVQELKEAHTETPFTTLQESPKGRQLRDAILAIDKLLAEIFVQWLPSLSADHYNRPSQKTPWVWNSFDLQSQFNIQLFRISMKGAGVSPLSFAADNDSLEIILPYSRRWERIALDLNTSSLRTLSTIRDSVPLLRRIYMKFSTDLDHLFHPGQPFEHPTATCDAFECAPNFRSVWIRAPPKTDHLVRYCQAATNVTTLTIAMHSMTSQLQELPQCILSHSQRLKVLNLFKDPLATSFIILINIFFCPALEDLELDSSSHADAPTLKTHLSPFLARSPLLKRRFRIGINDDGLLDIMAHTPALEEFILIHHRLLCAPFFEGLTYKSQTDLTSPLLCLRLRVFCVLGEHKIESPTAAVDMIASRRRVPAAAPVTRLERAAFSCDDPTCVARLDEFVAEGSAFTHD